jgi:hypothetical protein
MSRAGRQARPKGVNQLEREIVPVDLDNDTGLAVVDGQLAVFHVIPRGGMPPIHMPFSFEAATLSRMRSPVTSRSTPILARPGNIGAVLFGGAQRLFLSVNPRYK